MIVANFFHVKASNGLFFYGLDYLRENLSNVRVMLVRPALEAPARAALPECEIVVCDGRQFLREIRRARRRRDYLFTPTSHPLPGITRQWVVVHDAYPFVVGWRGIVKRALLTLCLATSRCQVGYINRTDALPFVESLGVSGARRVFAPNRFPSASPRHPRTRPPGGALAVGLVGTDSAKKNYAALFAALAGHEAGGSMAFRFYGHDSAYFRDVRRQFPQTSMTLVSSDQCSLAEFFQDIDLVVSVASQEGFGRPIAEALLAGIPCILQECGVFREFFSGAADFRPDAAAVAHALVQATLAPAARPAYAPPADVLRAFESANARLADLSRSSAKTCS